MTIGSKKSPNMHKKSLFLRKKQKSPGIPGDLCSGKSEIRTRDRIKSYTSLAGTRLRPARPSSHLGDTNFR